MGLPGVDTSLAPRIPEEFESLILHQTNAWVTNPGGQETASKPVSSGVRIITYVPKREYNSVGRMLDR